MVWNRKKQKQKPNTSSTPAKLSRVDKNNILQMEYFIFPSWRKPQCLTCKWIWRRAAWFYLVSASANWQMWRTSGVCCNRRCVWGAGKYDHKKFKAKYYSVGPYQRSWIVLNRERERRPPCLFSFPAGIIDWILFPSPLSGSGVSNQILFLEPSTRAWCWFLRSVKLFGRTPAELFPQRNHGPG